MTSGQFVRVTLPRLSRPNLVARLYMLCTAMGTAAVAWGVPGSTISRIMASGGAAAHIVVAFMVLATALGVLDILANDIMLLRNKSGGLICAAAAWLEDSRMQRCFAIGGCYLILTFAGIGSPVTGTFWILVYYLQMTFCSGLLGWSLRALMLATVPGGRDAAA